MTLTQEIVKVSDNSKSKVQLLLTTGLLCLNCRVICEILSNGQASYSLNGFVHCCMFEQFGYFSNGNCSTWKKIVKYRVYEEFFQIPSSRRVNRPSCG